VDRLELLELFDEQMRRRRAPDGLFAGDGWSAVLWWPGEGDVEALVARLRELPGHVEWKYYAHDEPADLPERLLAAGLVPEDEETLLVADVEAIPPPPPELDLRSEPAEFEALALSVFGRGSATGFPATSRAVVAYVDGRPASAGRVDLEPDSDFAGLFGGATLPEFRGRGLYRATVAKRAELARERGYRWLYVDALPTSRPILERLGFVALTTTTPYVPQA